ncbi:hypothetical protein [Erwinia sp. CGal63]
MFGAAEKESPPTPEMAKTLATIRSYQDREGRTEKKIGKGEQRK